MEAQWLSGAWRAVPVCALLWLAYLFGRTLASGRVPLIERVARVRDPDLSAALRRYTRRLTPLWTAYFVFSAFLAAVSNLSPANLSLTIWTATLVLFVGEHQLRPLLFRGKTFPSLVQQIVDTASVWRQRS